ncbi:polysaccharide biosynthesis protein [Corynebacterium gallinarum]|uniref:UDP-glucose 4-epimerase n=1 Tax=Corynebacterium gallinarum TaxID=2762214 RepID=A0A8I0LBM0_9CORY|nr:polysaccharide biosynthesis protein [Corynebacterium gallinarum]MBD8031022.1 polysaccharide biosynthesis protein [Corynebacterium gallinarum]
MTQINNIADSTVTITGGTGSFGSTMARQLLEKGAQQINIFSRDEAKQDEMRRKFSDERLRFFIGDVRDAASIAPAMRGADFVFHAAALKQVPSCEFFPQQAVLTNIVGSDNVIKEAEKAGVRSLVCLSTDKAVYPVNAMGMSKALMEKTAQAYARNFIDSEMTVSVTRYGNVMYSRGSVIPLFVKQLEEGKPMSLTDPSMTRFLMSLDDSVDLVEHAFMNANPGDIYVKKAPGATVEVLARAVASLLGNDDPDIQVIGARHGEKSHEALLSSEELAKASDEGDYFRIPLDARSLQYELYFEEGETEAPRLEDYDSANTVQLSIEETKQLLLKLPEMQKLVGA